MEYLLLQMLNGVQLGLLMFLLAAGLTLTFGIMDLVNLAHGSLYMMGAYIAWTLIGWTDSFVLGALLALAHWSFAPSGRAAIALLILAGGLVGLATLTRALAIGFAPLAAGWIWLVRELRQQHQAELERLRVES